MPQRLRTITVSALAASGMLLAGCSASSGDAPQASASTTDGDRIAVVSSTNVYGDIVAAIGGDSVEVTSIITSGVQDPHSYESSARDQLVISKAALLIGNGGGYDTFFEGLAATANPNAPLLNAVEYSHDYPGDGEADDHDDHDHADDADDHDHADDADDHDHAGDADDHDDHDHADEGDEADEHAGHNHIEGFNEHVWYDPHTIAHLAEAIADELGDLRPADEATFDANLATFLAGIEEQEAELERIAGAAAGAQVFVTEPVPLYLTAAAGLVDATPSQFSESVEEGQDVPPATLLEALKIIGSGDVRVVITNPQTAGAETDQVLAAADEAGLPIVEFTETLPEGQTYLRWMSQNVAALAQALGV